MPAYPIAPTYPPSPLERNFPFQVVGSHVSKLMFDSLDGRLTPTTRQNAGRSLNVRVAVGVVTVIVPDVTSAAEVTVVLPSDVNVVRSAQATGRVRPSSALACADAAASTTTSATPHASFMAFSPFPQSKTEALADRASGGLGLLVFLGDRQSRG